MKRAIGLLSSFSILILLLSTACLLVRGEGVYYLLLIIVLISLAFVILSRMIWKNYSLTERVLREMKQAENSRDYYRDVLMWGDDNQIMFQNEIVDLLEHIVDQALKENSEEILDKQAKLIALQSQINPHFLYNTLESIRGQALVVGHDEIAMMTKALAAFFRYSISKSGNLVTLRDELNNTENYMMIQKYRFNNRFTMEVMIDDEDEAAFDSLVPRLIIQPVVENAIYHGLEECLEGGIIEIEILLSDENLIITVSDNGQGMELKDLNELNDRIRNSRKYIREEDAKGQVHTGIALPNIHRRIQLMFGDEYGVQVYSTKGHGTDVEITIPNGYERNVQV